MEAGFLKVVLPSFVPHAVLEQFLQHDGAFLSGRAVALVCVSSFQQVIQTIITEHCLRHIHYNMSFSVCK